MAGGALVALLAILWGLSNIISGTLAASGFILLLGIMLPLVGALVGGGFYVFNRAGAEAAEMAGVQKQRKILNMVQTRGQVTLPDVMLEANMNRDEVKNAIYDLVGKGLFTGYIDWNQGTLYSRQAHNMREAGTCPNCGGKLELVGKGVIKCPYCGTEVFL